MPPCQFLMGDVSLEPGCCRIWGMFGPSSRPSYSQACCEKSRATLTHEDYRSRLPGVSGSHLHSILHSSSDLQCLQSLG